MTGVVFSRFVRDTRRSLAWWVLGMVGLVLFTVAFYPSVKGNEAFDKLFEDLPLAVRTLVGAQEGVPLTSPPGYLHGRLFSVMVPVLLVTLGIGLGARAIAGSEGDGTLELLLAQPVTRTRVVAERYGVVVAVLAAVSATITASLVALGPFVGLLDGITVGGLCAANGAVFCLALLHATLAFAVGCATGRSGAAVAVATSVAAGGYLVQSLAALGGGVPTIEGLSPWHWYLDRNILIDGLDPAAVIGPVVIAGLLFAAGCWLFNRRDLR
ncbi:MAG: ABC transporter permease subunit [Actinomycetota bacterium]|jgi:ABC-2 type transport system permease protein